MTKELLIEYAQLLRKAWLNPSHKPSQKAVHSFERKYDEKLHATVWEFVPYE